MTGIKKIFMTLFMVIVCTALITGCSDNRNNTGPASNTSDKAESTENVPTLDEVISVTWSLYAGYDQSGSLVNISSESAEYSFTFDADNGFSSVYRQSDGYIDAAFTSSYDVTDSKAAYENPYDWNYYATIKKDSISDSGQSTLLGKLGEQGLHLIFKFRELKEKIFFMKRINACILSDRPVFSPTQWTCR